MRRSDPSFPGFYHEEKYLDRFDKCTQNYQEIVSHMLVEVRDQEEDRVNHNSTELDVILELD